VKPIAFLGGSLDDRRGFPADARRQAGYQLDRVQRGLDPDDWRADAVNRRRVREIRVRERAGAFRVIYVALARGCGLRASRVPEEDAAIGETGCGFGGVSVAGTDGENEMTTPVFESVWDALEDTPTEAENMKLRSSLMIAITEAASAWGLTQTDAARRLGVTQPRLNDLLRGRVGKFSLDALVALAARAGLAVHMEITLAA
jgi:predicted XRE-type DNA-binding protein